MKSLHTFVYVLAFLTVVFDLYFRKEQSKYASDVGLTVPEVIAKHGYYIEKQEVETEDGYLLEMHRIPYGTKHDNKTKSKRIPVLLIHCFLGSSADWLFMGPEKSIGYILADSGYDVWMGNHRGTTYSRKHKNLDPEIQNGGFWNFSLHDLGAKDIPAMVDFILKKTGQESLHVIGHSQGTLTTFLMLSTRPEYNKKVKLFTAFSPAVHIDFEGIRNTFCFITYPYAKIFSDFFQWGEGMQKTNVFSRISANICREDSYFFFICKTFMMRIVGTKKPKYDNNLLQIVMSHTPAGTSWKILEHFHQIIRYSEYKQFDYGLEGNLREYNSSTPPMYNLSNVVSPVAMYYAKSDIYVHAPNVIRLANELKNVSLVHHIDDEHWTHTDFLWAEDAKDLLYEKTVSEMKKYDNV